MVDVAWAALMEERERSIASECWAKIKQSEYMSMAIQSDVTTVIPFYNGEAFLEEALTSLARELLHSDEVIIVDDGSSEESSRRLELIVGSFPCLRIRVIKQANTGQGGARNAGVEQAKTSYVAFLDQDDRVHPCHNKLLVEALKSAQKSNPNTLYANGDVRQINARSEVVCNFVCRRNRRHRLEDAMELVSSDLFILPGGTLVDRSLFLELGGFDSRLKGYEDDDLFIRAYRQGYGAALIPEEVADWRIHSSSTSYGLRMMESRYLYYCKLLEMFPDDPFQSRIYSLAIDRRFRYWFRHDYVKALADLKSDGSPKARKRFEVAQSIWTQSCQIRQRKVPQSSLLFRCLSRVSRGRITRSRYDALRRVMPKPWRWLSIRRPSS